MKFFKRKNTSRSGHHVDCLYPSTMYINSVALLALAKNMLVLLSMEEHFTNTKKAANIT